MSMACMSISVQLIEILLSNEDQSPIIEQNTLHVYEVKYKFT